MVRVCLDNHCFELSPHLSLLEGLEAEGIEWPNQCRSGKCQTCLVRVLEGAVPEASQQGLKPSLAMQNFAMSCLCFPEEDLCIAGTDAALMKVKSTVTSKASLTAEVIELRLKPDQPLRYRAGQFIHLVRPADGLRRSYSMASLPSEDGDELLFHIRRVSGGSMSEWLFNHVRHGDVMEVQGPFGDCFYVPGANQQSLLMVATGTGLAPLWGILRDALRHGHQGDIHLYHGSRTLEGLYLVNALRDLSARYPQLHYYPCMSGAVKVEEGFYEGRANLVALSHHPQLKGWRVYLCGHPEMVSMMRKKTFLAGVAMKDIHMDAFIS